MERIEATADQIERARRGESAIAYTSDRSIPAGSPIEVYDVDRGVLVGKVSVPISGLWPGDTLVVSIWPRALI